MENTRKKIKEVKKVKELVKRINSQLVIKVLIKLLQPKAGKVWLVI